MWLEYVDCAGIICIKTFNHKVPVVTFIGILLLVIYLHIKEAAQNLLWHMFDLQVLFGILDLKRKGVGEHFKPTHIFTLMSLKLQ